MTAFWDITPYNLAEVGRRFRGANRLHRQGDRPASTRTHDGEIFHRALISMLEVVLQEPDAIFNLFSFITLLNLQ
jgi:hypothetical protein